MKELYKATKITDDVYWVGAIDWAIRDFHGYATTMGTTYNAYLILDEKITLIDTVKPQFKEEFFARIKSVINIEDIDYIISNHSEMDHSGVLPDIIKVAKPEKVIASNMGVKALKQHFNNLNYDIIAAQNNESISIGKNTLTFIESKMLHWPDSMLTYMPEKKILFSNDVFGMHLAGFELFDYQIDDGLLEYEAMKYYSNIIMPFAQFVVKAMQMLDSMNLEIDYIATDHGPIWHKKIDKVINWYKKWAEQKPTRKAVITYDTMWGSTDKMAHLIAEGINSEDIPVKLMPMKSNHRSDIITEVFNAGAMIIGTPVLNNNMYPAVADVLTYIKGLKPKHIIGSGFGSYGWSKSPLDFLRPYFTESLGVEFVGDVVISNYVPDKACLKQCYDQGKLIAHRLKEIC